MNNSIQLSSYLTFNGNCEEAMNFYKSVLGGDLEISRFDAFGEAPEGYADKVMHCTLDNGIVSFMASDGMPGNEVTFGGNISISVAGQDSDKLTAWFNGLSAGGEVKIPLEKQVWGDTFGMFTDKFGFQWLFNISSGEAAQQ